MKLFRFFIGSLFLVIMLLSCKNEPKNTEVSPSAATSDITQKMEKAALTKTEKKQVNSIMAKMMVTPELSMFTSTMVSTQLSDLLLNSEGPLTIFAPSNDAFENIPEATKKIISDPKNKEALTTLLKNHIIEEDLTSSMLLQSIQKNGEYSLKTIGGVNLTAYLDDGDIMVKDSSGITAKIGKSDILGSNGKLHILDAVLSTTK